MKVTIDLLQNAISPSEDSPNTVATSEQGKEVKDKTQTANRIIEKAIQEIKNLKLEPEEERIVLDRLESAKL